MPRIYNDFEGVLAVDKPSEWTSQDVVAKIRGHFQLRKVGHAGTLDPMATGLLVILCGRCTKLMDPLMAMAKSYLMEVAFGLSTDTQDITGTVTAERPLPPNFGEEALLAAMENFKGEIMQTPPMYSAVKINGRRLYKAARQGQEVERQKRPVTIYDFELLKLEAGRAIMQCRCSKGTYVRTLASDLGDSLGCGATLAALRRTSASGLAISGASTLDEILNLDLAALKEKMEATRLLVKEASGI